MNSKKILKISATTILIFFVLGCGVRGDPLPPELPPEIGRGRPSYQRAGEDLRLSAPPPVEADQRFQDEDEDDEKEEDE